MAEVGALDIVTIGRSSVDLYGEQIGGRLEDMQSFAKYVGGSPTNTAVGVARLGMRPGLITRVGNDHFGRFIREQLEREGVDVRGVATDAERLTALAILGIRNQVDFPLVFYRENCADMALGVDDIEPGLIADTRAVLFNGTHISSPTTAAACRKACEMARAGGAKVVFDIDYRPVLWGLTSRDNGEDRFVADAAVSARLQEFLGLCDLIVGTEEEVHILGGSTDTLTALRTIRAGSDALIVLKRGALGCICFDGAIPDSLDEGIAGAGFNIEVFNVLGAGDSFMAGFLRGWLAGEQIETCCTWANACGAIVVSRHGCAPAMPTWEELQQFLDAEDRPYRLREDVALEHLHWATTRYPDLPELMVLALDHRSQLVDMARELGADEGRIPAFKALALDAVDRLAQGDPAFGVLLDGRFGMRGLERAADFPYWIGRPIELPGSRPLEFESSADVATELCEWPYNHVAKCLVFAHPDDEVILRERQERQVARLYDACRKTRHELLLEVIVPQGMESAPDTVSRMIERYYDLGVRPDWWKLEPASDVETWANIQDAILKHDPRCRGVVILGLAAPDEVLLRSFAAVRDVPVVKGFAVGRTIWAEAARKWLAGEIDDAQALDMLVERFGILVRGWREARKAVARESAA
ncbi:5-dehydro-2-deoxygluconokinase [Novosphingobium sp. CF614]|uniref:bifunctional 5-dehydro-2-deoxygluconokinase/5-dehydro-2- deoxyphosphogluconate aldolase n=1 Tax=Novosphingobium sp. CF614 TaxID=1884364 RepID=UPI0008E890B9|nr:5-dehydro-2-deoxygluconokinase [Novosphingobium sp. CF614]SFG08029.1 5-dehydro-2-deoxygluconokinase [Novosphingobium sp. CF614]